MRKQLDDNTEEFEFSDIHVIDIRGRSKNCSNKEADRRDLGNPSSAPDSFSIYKTK